MIQKGIDSVTRKLPMNKRLPLTRLVLIVLLASLFTFMMNAPVDAEMALDPCEPPECVPTEPSYELPPPENSNRTWNGYTDGRIDPRLDDAYNVYCANDEFWILGGKPQPQELVRIPLTDLLDLPQPVGAMSINGVTITRYGDTVIVEGSNGNTTPDYALKIFNISACIESNGGIPEGYEPPAPPAPPAIPDYDPNAPSTTPNQTMMDFNRCMQSDTFRSLADCLLFSVDEQDSSGIQVIWSWILILCTSPIGLVFAVPVLRLRRRRGTNSKIDSSSL